MISKTGTHGKMNKFVRNSILILFSIVVALLIAEGVSRVLFDPIDFLKPRRVSDPVLGYRIEPGSGAHDSLGFRNRSVPQTADIVAIGDSHTYGISATASDSWPSQLERLTGRKVYNVSLGGYGPAEYLYLMEKYALALHPKIIIAGFYLGNDLKDTYRSVYNISHWKDLRKPGEVPADGEEEGEGEDDSSRGIGEWLSGRSVLYRLVSSSFIGDNLRQMRRLRRGEEIMMFENADLGISTGFTPDRRLKGLDLSRGEVREGLELSLELFNSMNELAERNDMRFLVVIIPTKESVFSAYIEGRKDLDPSARIDRLIESERRVDKIVKTYFNEHGIEYVDVLDPLKKEAGNEQLYPNNFGGHSNKNGYGIIAGTISSYLEEN